MTGIPGSAAKGDHLKEAAKAWKQSRRVEGKKFKKIAQERSRTFEELTNEEKHRCAYSIMKKMDEMASSNQWAFCNQAVIPY